MATTLIGIAEEHWIPNISLNSALVKGDINRQLLLSPESNSTKHVVRYVLWRVLPDDVTLWWMVDGVTWQYLLYYLISTIFDINSNYRIYSVWNWNIVILLVLLSWMRLVIIIIPLIRSLAALALNNNKYALLWQMWWLLLWHLLIIAKLGTTLELSLSHFGECICPVEMLSEFAIVFVLGPSKCILCACHWCCYCCCCWWRQQRHSDNSV